MRLSIHLQRDVARLHFHDISGSDRSIADQLGISPSTVGVLRKALVKSETDWATLQTLDDHRWRNTLGTHNRSIAVNKPAPDWDWIHEEMQREDATLEGLWQAWRETCPDGIGYSQFTTSYRRFTKQLNIVMRRVHTPGDKLFVDFAGRTVPVNIPHTQNVIHAQIFVSVLGFSNYTFVYAVPDQTIASWVECHVKCFEYMEGVPKWVVSDNLKAAVIRRERDRIVINPTYRECLSHYDSAPRPARSRRPKDKGKVEVGVKIIQRFMLFKLRDRVFFDIDELNEELRNLCDQLNAHPFKKLPGSRSKWFEEREQMKLRPLPVKAFELCEWRYQVRVNTDYHLEHGGSYYSVPSHLIGNRVDLRYDSKTLEVFFNGRRVALHSFQGEAGLIQTLDEHRPVAHQRVVEGEPADLLQWADSVGANAKRMIVHHLEDRNDLTNGLRTAQRMRELTRKYGEERFEHACGYALTVNIKTLRNMESILKNKTDLRPATTPATTSPEEHENLRGGDYFED